MPPTHGGDFKQVKICHLIDDAYSISLTPALILECMTGDLTSLLNYPPNGIPLTGKQLVILMYDIVSAYVECHRLGFVHRDAKPGNTLTWSDGRNVWAKIGDFGSAISLRSEPVLWDATKPSIPGTALYRPPEVWYYCDKMDYLFGALPSERDHLTQFESDNLMRKRREYKTLTCDPALDAWGVGCIIAWYKFHTSWVFF